MILFLQSSYYISYFAQSRVFFSVLGKNAFVFTTHICIPICFWIKSSLSSSSQYRFVDMHTEPKITQKPISPLKTVCCKKVFLLYSTESQQTTNPYLAAHNANRLTCLYLSNILARISVSIFINKISSCGEQLVQFPSSLSIWIIQAANKKDLSYSSLFDLVK